MKKANMKRIASLLLALATVFSTLILAPVVTSADDGDPADPGVFYTDEATGIEISYTRMFEENGVPITALGGFGAHGGHETRIVRTEGGTYATYITDSRPADEEHEHWDNGIGTFSVIKITADGFHVIFTDIFPISMGSCTPNILNAGDGKLYVTIICGDPDIWAETWGTDHFKNGAALSVYEIDTATDEVTAPEAPTLFEYETTPFEDHGYGYTQPILDKEHGKLYAVTCGGEAPGYIAWFIYDLETKTWDDEVYTVELFTRRCYINGYPDGNGGFTMVIERCAPVTSLKEVLGVNFQQTSGYVWDGLYVMHIADPTVEEVTADVVICEPNYTEEGYNNTGKNRVDNASHYGPNGCTYLDDQSRLHVIYTQKIGNTGVTSVYHEIYTLEGEQLFKELIPTKLLPNNGKKTYKGTNGFAMTQGSDGKYYIFCLANGNTAILEIWSSPANDGKKFTKIVGPVELQDKDGNPISKASTPIIGNTRNFSVLDGTADIMFHSTDSIDGNNPYYHVSVKLNDPPHVHSYEDFVTEPTCTEQGYTTHVCSGCGDTYVDTYTDPLGHDFGDWVVTTDPTCTGSGEQTRVCARCGETETQPVDALGHDYTTVVTEPTCTGQGYTTHTCSRCGDNYVDNYVDPLGHDWDDGAVTTPATETEDGVMTYTCRRCGETKTEVIPKTGRELIDTTKIFKDVKPGKWYTEAVNYVYTYELMNGMTDDTFAPNADMSRAMLVTVLWRAEGSPAPKGAAPFTDLKAKWYKEAVAWAYENKIVNGMSETSFAPDSSVTREQIAAIFYRFAEFKGRDVTKTTDISKFPDGAKVSKYARTAMSWAVADGLISGTKVGGKDYLDPKGNATRAQVATILMRYLTGGKS